MPPNPVTDKLTQWQNDADTNDTNQPVNSTLMSDGQPGDLDGELRRIKSEVRQESLTKSWERWLGLLSVSQPNSLIVFNYNGPNQFVTNESPTRMRLFPGRRVRILDAGGEKFGTIWSVVYVAPNTAIACDLDGGLSLTAPITEVQFGVDGASTPAVLPFLLQNKAGLTLGPGMIVVPSTVYDSAVALVPQAATSAPILVAVDYILTDAWGRFVTAGPVYPLNVNSNTVRGRYLVSAGASNVNAQDSGTDYGNTRPPGTFAVSMSTTVAAGQISALLLGGTEF